jgi:adenine-specific DNA-methyltransferase
MDYVETITKERVKKVIVNNNSGGSFIYMEIKKQNEEWVEKILEAKAKEELLDIWTELKESEYLCYKVNPEKDNKKNEIEDLEPDNLKDFLIKVIDKNALYLNFKDMEDEKIGLNEKEINLNKEFYGENE